MSLRKAIRKALTGNDVEAFDKLVALRRECRERDIDADKVNELIRKVIHEDSKPKAMPKPEAPQPEPQPVTPEPPQAVQDKRTEQELSRRVKFSGEPIREREDSESKIIMMAEDKKNEKQTTNR